MTYQQEAERQEKQDWLARLVKTGVEMGIEKVIENATCFECDNPVTVIRTEDGGITIRPCEKCHGPSLEIDTPFLQALVGMDVVIGKINSLTQKGNGRV